MLIKTSRNRKLVAAAKEICRELRKRQTAAENILWQAVRDRKFLDKKFYCQHPLFFSDVGTESFFVADFYCHEERHVVELDGRIHDFQKEYDAYRTDIIGENGITILRFKNEENENNLENVLQRLAACFKIKETHPPLPPSLSKRRGTEGVEFKLPVIPSRENLPSPENIESASRSFRLCTRRLRGC